MHVLNDLELWEVGSCVCVCVCGGGGGGGGGKGKGPVLY